MFPFQQHISRIISISFIAFIAVLLLAASIEPFPSSSASDSYMHQFLHRVTRLKPLTSISNFKPISPIPRYFSMSSTAQSGASDVKPEEQHTEANKPILALPDIPATEKDPVGKINIGADGSTTISLDHLGPMVVNQDGTLSRISNWQAMTDIEKQNTLRVLGKRNKLRMDALKAQEAQNA